MALQSGYTLATESPFAWEVPHKIMVQLTHLDALCCIDWGGDKGGNWNLYGDSSWSALASELNCLRTLLGSAMCWSFLRCTRHWVSETNHSSFPSDSLQSANVQKKHHSKNATCHSSMISKHLVFLGFSGWCGCPPPFSRPCLARYNQYTTETLGECVASNVGIQPRQWCI